MTTNKPEVKRYDCTNGGAQHCYGCYTMEEGELGDYVEWEAYEALQAECERWKNAAHGAHRQLTANRLETEKLAVDWSKAMAECEKLRKDAERYRPLLEAVLREIPHREGSRGNAPGHGHSVPGIWDEDNGALAGKECAWCKVWNEAVSAMQEPTK